MLGSAVRQLVNSRMRRRTVWCSHVLCEVPSRSSAVACEHMQEAHFPKNERVLFLTILDFARLTINELLKLRCGIEGRWEGGFIRS